MCILKVLATYLSVVHIGCLNYFRMVTKSAADYHRGLACQKEKRVYTLSTRIDPKSV
jgi:hypothetical protein